MIKNGQVQIALKMDSAAEEGCQKAKSKLLETKQSELSTPPKKNHVSLCRKLTKLLGKFG